MGETCARLVVNQPDGPNGTGVIYVKGRWFASRFSLTISDGFNAWTCQASQEELSRKAFSWDYTEAQYLEQAKEHLDHQNPNSTYSFTPIGNGSRKLSWTLEKDGVRLIANWTAEKSLDPKEITCDILDCLMNGSSRLSEELQRKTRSFESMKAEAQRLTAQNQEFKDQKVQFEVDIYRKFVAVLNSKKAKLRELRDSALRAPSSKQTKEIEEAVYETDREDEVDESEGEDEKDFSLDRRESETAGQVAAIESADNTAAKDLFPEAPMEDAFVAKPDSSSTMTKDDVPKREINADLHKATDSEAPKSPSKVESRTITDAATLLSGPTYVSAPRKRRR